MIVHTHGRLPAARIGVVGLGDRATFSLDRLLTLSRSEIDTRYRLFEKLTRFESL